MNILQFAVASIVDVNTGNGLAHHSDSQDNVALEQHGRGNCTNSITRSIDFFKTKLVAIIDDYRARSK